MISVSYKPHGPIDFALGLFLLQLFPFLRFILGLACLPSALLLSAS